MSRPSFVTTIPGALTYENLLGGTPSLFSVPSRFAYETSGGTSRRKPVGWMDPTPYNVHYKQLRGATGIHEVRKVYPTYVQGYRYTGVVGPTDNQVGPINIGQLFDSILTESEAEQVSGLANSSLIKARNNLKGTTVNLGVAFAERNKTANMLGDTARRIARAARSLRRGEIRNAMRHLGLSSKDKEPRGRNWTQNWLQLQYGWKPLLSDVYGAVEALHKQPPESYRIQAKGTAQTSLERSKLVKTEGGNAKGYLGSSVGFKGAVTRIIAIPPIGFMNSLTSLGITNPLEVAWELVPLSFVVDWATPIGSWLSSLDAMVGYESATTVTSTYIRAEWKVSGLPGVLSDGSSVSNDWNANKRVFHLDRTVTGFVPMASYPGLKDPRSLGHMANGLALLAQAFR